MKRLIYAVMLLLGLSIFGSCSKEGGSTGGGSWLVGDWAPIFESGNQTTDYYLSFSRDGIFTIYYAYTDDDYEATGWFDSGTLFCAPNVHWEKDMQMEYKISGGKLITMGMVVGSVNKINNNKFILDADNDYEGTYERIKSFKKQAK